MRRTICGLCILYLVSVSLFVHNIIRGAAITTNSYCLEIESPTDSQKLILVNPRTGKTSERLVVPVHRLANYADIRWLDSISADGWFRAYLILSDDLAKQDEGEGDLVIISLKTGNITRFPVGHFMAFDGLTGRFEWSHENSELAFTDYGASAVTIYHHLGESWTTYTANLPNRMPLGWSQDDKFFGFTQSQNNQSQLTFIRLADFAMISTPPVTGVFKVVWSPQGHRVAYIVPADTANGGKKQELVISSPEESIPIPIGNVYSSSFAWSSDASTLVFFSQNDHDVTMMSYDLASQQSMAIIDHIASDPFYPRSSAARMIVAWSSPAGQINVDLVRPDGKEQIHVLTSTDNVVELPDLADNNYSENSGNGGTLSADRSRVAFVWMQRGIDHIYARLTWIRTDGTDRHDLAPIWGDIDTVLWSDNGRLLLYKARTTEGVELGMIDTQTGIQQIIGNHLTDAWFGRMSVYYNGIWDEDVEKLDETRSRLSMTLLAEDRTAKLRLFYLDGTLFQDYILIGSFPNFSWPDDVESPDGERALVYVTDGTNSTLQLATARQAIVLVPSARAITLNYFNSWSPDGQMIAYSYLSTDGKSVYVIASRQGQVLWQNDKYNSFSFGFTWHLCL